MIQTVILCGGSGTRLWPLSRQSLPKQFVPLINSKSLLQLTFERASDLTPGKTIWTVANKEHRFLLRDAAKAANISHLGILEPIGRNTTAAMAAAALNSASDQILLFLTADHHIPNESLFNQTVQKGISKAKEGAFVTFGIKPNHPHTKYGYIKVNEFEKDVSLVEGFIEKPDYETAVNFLGSGNYFWNAGIFLVRADTLIDSIKQFAPDILEVTLKAFNAKNKQDEFIFLDEAIFTKCRSESIDYAVLEKYKNVFMVPFYGEWSDVGSWNAVADLLKSDSENNQINDNGFAIDAKNTFIYAKYRPVVALGTGNLLIIDTPDALLVASKAHTEKVKDVVKDLKDRGLPQATEHREVARPWGKYICIDRGEKFKVKRITVNIGASLSLQLHNHRAEHWVVVKGLARVTKGNEIFSLAENESTYIPIGIKHRLENIGEILLEMIEVQSGDYLGEDDIKRFDDDYGRVFE